MRAYRERKRAAGLTRPSDHRLREARSLALHCRAAVKIAANLELLDVARDNLRRWAANAGEDAPRYP